MEEDIKVQICRLCFSLISDKSFSSIRDSIKDMLQVITTDLDLDATNSPVMCLECSKSIQEVFNFKTNFFESEEKVESKIANVKHKKLNLRDVMNNGRPKRQSTEAKLKNEFCRTCLERIEGNTFMSLNKNVSSMLDSCLPELDLNVTSDPVMCQTCYKTLQKMGDFKAVCEKNESHIKAYSKMCSRLPKKVNLHSVLQFLFDSESKSGIAKGIAAKIEYVEVNGGVKNEENLDQGEEGQNLDDCSQYVMVKMEPNDEKVVTAQIKKELKEEISDVKNCLEYVMVKMECTNDEGQIGLVQNNTDLQSSLLTSIGQDNYKGKSKDNLSNHRSQSRISCKRLKQNKDANKSDHNSMTYCSDCDFKTKYKHNLRRHLAVCHEREDMIYQRKFYQCEICDFATKFRIDLTKHTLCHVKPEALQCTRCAFSTSQNSQLIKHLLSHVTAENMDKYSFLQLLKKAQ